MDTENEIAMRIRHKIVTLREEEKRLSAAYEILMGSRKEGEPLLLGAGTIDVVAVEVVEKKAEAVKVPRKIKTRGNGLSAKIRQGVAKIGPATTGEVTAWLHKNGFSATTSSTASALLWDGRKRGEYSKDSEARWTYTGGLR